MKIKRARIFLYELLLMKPLAVKNNLEKTRTGLVLQLEDEHGFAAHSEIAPLTGLHQESLCEARAQLENFLPTLVQEKLEGANFENLFPSVRMSVDLALMQLRASQKGQFLHHYINPHASNTVRLRTLLDLQYEEDAVEAAVHQVNQGFRTLKIKVGKKPLPEEILLLQKIRKAVGFDVEITLDANRAFDLSQAVEFGHACLKQRIAYIEEPVASLKDMIEFHRATQIKIALDETLQEIAVEQWYEAKNAIGALIVKPGIVGGLKPLKRLVAFAKKSDIKLVFSSAFESGLGHLLWALLVAAFDEQKEAHGLGTYAWFKEDLLLPPFRAFRGEVEIEFWAKSLELFHAQNSHFCKSVFDVSA